jgi:sterol desaturase/sphingolipid hydroxylase (fatty acid hydroxylase superfamily)
MSNASFGFTPRLPSPRPKYPSLFVPIYSFLKSCVWQAGVLSTVFTYLLYPSYKYTISLLKPEMPDVVGFTLLLSVSHIFMWTLCTVPFYIFDSYGYFREYKLHRSKGQTPSASLINDTFFTAAVSQLVTSPLLAYFIYPVFLYFGLKPLHAELPPLVDILQTYCIAFFFNDTMFYYTHRILHTKALYFLHKQHHKYAGTMGIAAEYANPIESIFSNIIPSIGGVVLFGCHHPLCVLIWIAMRLQQTYFAHSGYAFRNTWIDFIGLGHSESAIFHGKNLFVIIYL